MFCEDLVRFHPAFVRFDETAFETDARWVNTSRSRGEGNSMEDSQRRMIWSGMLLFLIGLLTGFIETSFANVRMALAAHLEGVMNGIFLIALGAAWPAVRLTPRLQTLAFWGALYGTYMNWVMTTLAAIFGTGALSPIIAAGHTAQPWQEAFVTGGFMTVGLGIVGTAILILYGLRRTPRSQGA